MTNPLFKLIAISTRKQWLKNDLKRDEGCVLPDDVTVHKNISYGPHKKWNLLDLNIPDNYKNGKIPVIVNFHGGGFFYGTKEIYKFYCAELCHQGFAVLNFNYRLSPENKFPAHLEDCNAALTWLYENADTYNIDLSKLFFVGDSAGGNLVFFYSTILTNPDYAKLFDFTVPKLTPTAVAMNCALYNLSFDKKDIIYKIYIAENYEKYKAQLTPGDFVTENFPPSYLMSATKDFLLPQLQPAYDFFTSKGIKVKKEVYGSENDKDATHVFHVNTRLDIAKKCNNDEINFFKDFI